MITHNKFALIFSDVVSEKEPLDFLILGIKHLRIFFSLTYQHSKSHFLYFKETFHFETMFF